MKPFKALGGSSSTMARFENVAMSDARRKLFSWDPWPLCENGWGMNSRMSSQGDDNEEDSKSFGICFRNMELSMLVGQLRD